MKDDKQQSTVEEDDKQQSTLEEDDKQQSTLEDILLELMVQNETLDKIQTNTLKALDLVPTRQEEEKKEEKQDANTEEAAVKATGTDYSRILEDICKGIQDICKGILGVNDSVLAVAKTSTSIETGLAILSSYADQISERLRLVMEDVSFITTLLSDDADRRREDRMQAEENRKEMIDVLKRLGRGGGEEKDKTLKGTDKPATFMEKLLGGLAIIGGLITGFVAGLVGYFAKLFKDITAAVSKILQIDKFLAKIGLDAKFFAKLTKPFKDLIASIKNVFVSVSELFSDAFRGMKQLSTGEGALAKFAKFFTKIKDYMVKLYESFASKFGKFFGIGKVLGVIVGKLMIFWDVFQSIKAAFDKFGETGDLGEALGTGIKELLGRVIGAPLDLLKSAVSWILGKFGFSNAEQFLDSFSITAAIEEAIDRVVTAGRNIFAAVFQFIQDFIDDFSNGMSEGGILGGIGKVFEKLAYYLIAQPIDWLINKLADMLPSWIPGRDKMVEWLRGLDVAKSVGKGLTFTDPPEFKSENKGMSYGDAVKKRTADSLAKSEEERVNKHIAEQDRLLKSEADKTKEQLKPDSEKTGLPGWLGTFQNAQEAFTKAFKENLEGGQTQIGAVPSTAGAEISAIQKNNDELNADSALNMATQSAPAASRKPSNISSQSVTYNSSNIPDKTSWMTMPLANWGH